MKAIKSKQYSTTFTNATMQHIMTVTFPLLAILINQLALVVSQRFNEAAYAHDEGRCHCMEYWECVVSGGTPKSYCGPSENQVCCFIPKNAKPVGILPRPSKKSQCGKKGSTSDGNRDGNAEAAEWPWQAAILEKPHDIYVCGASLLDEKWLLTAAHCVYTYLDQPPPLKIRLGEYDVSNTEEIHSYEELNIDRVILHPGFINTTLLNDIALLRLAKRAEKRPNIDIVCMPTADFDDTSTTNQRCIVTGWGRLNENSDHSTEMKEIPVPLWSNKNCQTALQSQFGPNFIIPPTAICAGSENRDACDGDGGGPLVCEHNGRWEQVGIVSYGVGCGRSNLPGVYTRVLAYSSWIKQTIRANS